MNPVRPLAARALAVLGALTLASSLQAAAPASSEQDPSLERALGLDQAVALSVQNAPRLLALDALTRAAEADRDGARAASRPQADLQAGYTRQSEVPELALTLPGQPPRVIFPNLPDNWRFRAQASWPVYTGGRVPNLIDAASSEARATASDREAARSDLAYEAASAYWSVVVASESEKVLSEALLTYEAHLTDARNREKLGLSARNEVLTIEVERDRADLLRLEASNGLAVSQANLVRLTGLPPGSRVVATEALAVPAVPAPELEELVARALEGRSERAAARARVDAASARVRSESASKKPQVALSGGFDYSNPNRRILPLTSEWQDSWDLGLAVSWNLFDSGRTAATTARAQARKDASSHLADDLDRRIRLEVTRARLDLESARARVQVSERALEAARESTRVSSERHREGVIGSAERLDAETRLLRAGLDRTQALAGLRLAQAALDRALGL